jgi:hypothetical protein
VKAAIDRVGRNKLAQFRRGFARILSEPTRESQPRAFRGGTASPRQIREIFFSATRDSKSGIIY